MLRRAKDAGLHVTASASINHLTLNENDIGPYRTFLKLRRRCAPRTTARLVEALADGLIDVIMSDHNPQDVETKRLPFAEAAPGAIGLETMLAAGLRLVHSGEIELDDAAAGDVDAAGRTARPAGRHAQARRAGRLIVSTRRALGARSGRAQVEVQEHAVRRGAPAGPRRAHHRRRPHGLRIRRVMQPDMRRDRAVAASAICSARSRSA